MWIAVRFQRNGYGYSSTDDLATTQHTSDRHWTGVHIGADPLSYQ